MARTFPEPLAITVPLRTTWEEVWELQDDAQAPVDLTGYELRMQVRDKRTGAELLSIQSEASPAYATLEPAAGRIAIVVPSDVVAALSPDNRKVSARWDAELYIPGQPEYVIPLLRGSASFQPRVTVLP